MKIGSFFDPFRSLVNRPGKKEDGGGHGSGSEHPGHHEQSGEDEASRGSPKKPHAAYAEVAAAVAKSDEKIDDVSIQNAIESFRQDTQAQVTGITVDRVGSGPGLKIVLKDREGSVLRQLSGEEFVKLRGETTAETPVRGGKLLDQKV